MNFLLNFEACSNGGVKLENNYILVFGLKLHDKDTGTKEDPLELDCRDLLLTQILKRQKCNVPRRLSALVK